MKRYYVLFCLMNAVNLLVLADAVIDTDGQLEWNILSANDIVMNSIQSKIAILQQQFLVEDNPTFTVISTLQSTYNSFYDEINNTIVTTNAVANSLQSIESKIDSVDLTIEGLTQDIYTIHNNDFNGTWTSIAYIKQDICDVLIALQNDLNNTSQMIDALSGAQLSYFLDTCTTIESLAIQVVQNLTILNEIAILVVSRTDTIESCLDIISDINTTLLSKIDLIRYTVEDNFNGTYTALTTLSYQASAIDMAVSEALSSVVDVSSGTIDEIDISINVVNNTLQTICSTMQIITSCIDPLFYTLDALCSKVDSTFQITDTLIESVQAIDTFSTTIHSKIDLINTSKSTAISKITEVESTVDESVLLSEIIESKIDVDSKLIQTVASSTDVLQSAIDRALLTACTIESTVDNLNISLNTNQSIIDAYAITESHIGILCNTIINAIDTSSTIDSKIDVLNALFLIGVNTVRTIESTVDTIILKTYTMNSSIDVFKNDVSTINSRLDVVIRGIISVESKVCVLESSIDHMDSKVDRIQKNSTTTNSNLDILATDFIYTWTILKAMDNKSSTINVQMITIQSKVDVLKNMPPMVDLSGSFTALKKIERTFNSVNSVLDSIAISVPDVAGTFTALQRMVDKSCTMLEAIQDANSGVITAGLSACAGTLITAAMIGTTGFTINTPGKYLLDSHIAFVPTAAATAITINASNVELDLCQKTLLHTPATAFTVIGIEVNGSVANVTIKNGVIRQMDGDNIRIGDGATRVTIDNVRVLNAESNGINCVGLVKNFTIIQSLIQASGSAGLRIQRGSDILIHDTLFSTNTSGGIVIDPGSGVVEQVSISNCLFAQNSSHGVNMEGMSGTITNIIIDGCSSLINTGAGIRASKVTNSIFKNNILIDNTINGIHLVDAVESLEIYNNVIRDNTGYGIIVDDTNALPCSIHYNVMAVNSTANYREDASAGSHSVLGNYALNVAETDNYSIGGGTGPTTINKSIIDQGTGTFSTRPEKWRNISMTT